MALTNCGWCGERLLNDVWGTLHASPKCAMWLKHEKQPAEESTMSTAATGLTQSTTKIDPELCPCPWCGAMVVIREGGKLRIHPLPVCAQWDNKQWVDMQKTQSFSTPSTVKVGDTMVAVKTIETPKTTGRYSAIGQEIGELVEKKQQAYGDSFGKSGAVLRILYPNGVPPEQLDDALTIVRILDKIFRVATDRDALGESPYRDIVGYGLLALARIEKEKP